jgi:hypothetical protein
MAHFNAWVVQMLFGVPHHDIVEGGFGQMLAYALFWVAFSGPQFLLVYKLDSLILEFWSKKLNGLQVRNLINYFVYAVARIAWRGSFSVSGIGTTTQPAWQETQLHASWRCPASSLDCPTTTTSEYLFSNLLSVSPFSPDLLQLLAAIIV